MYTHFFPDRNQNPKFKNFHWAFLTKKNDDQPLFTCIKRFVRCEHNILFFFKVWATSNQLNVSTGTFSKQSAVSNYNYNCWYPHVPNFCDFHFKVLVYHIGLVTEQRTFSLFNSLFNFSNFHILSCTQEKRNTDFPIISELFWLS